MKTICVLALVLLASSALAEVSNKRTALITKHIYTLAQTGYAVDTVLQLLNAIDNVQHLNLQTLNDNWALTEAALLDNIANLQALDDAQHTQCDNIQDTLTALKHERSRYVQYIKDAQNTLEVDAQNLADRLDKRCASNLLYVQHLKANQDAVKLLGFLRDQLSTPGFADYLASNNGAFVELKDALKSNKNKKHSLHIFLKHHMLATIQQAYTGEDELNYNVEARTADEIGNGEVDNDQGVLSLEHFGIDQRDLADFVAATINYVEELIEEVRGDSKQSQDSEFAAVEDLIDYQDQIEHNHAVLNRYIDLWSQHVDDLTATIEDDVEALADCQERADELDEQLEDAQEDEVQKKAAYEARRESLEDTISAIEEVIEVYQQTVADAGEDYKKKYDEEIEEDLAADRQHDQDVRDQERQEIQDQEKQDLQENGEDEANDEVIFLKRK